MIARLFDFGKGKHKHEPCGLRPLYGCKPGTTVTVVSNKDRKTFEMGLCNGVSIRVIENRENDSSMIVGAGEGRYIIARDTARHIKVR